MSGMQSLAKFVLASTVVVSAAVLLLVAHSAGSSSEPTVDVPKFSIVVKLTPRAETRLRAIHESIKVLAMFDGDPLPGQGKYNPPNRDVYLGSAERLVDRNNVASFQDVKIPLRDWERLSDKNYFVTINTFSARISENNNLLDCDGPMSRRIETFRDKSIDVHCSLIRELKASIK